MQALPKSMILIPLFDFDLSIMFSGFKSQWMIFIFFRKSKETNSWMPIHE